jgi:hypothetical protein
VLAKTLGLISGRRKHCHRRIVNGQRHLQRQSSLASYEEPVAGDIANNIARDVAFPKLSPLMDTTEEVKVTERNTALLFFNID